MRSSFLLAIGLVFLSLALLGMAYLSIPYAREERQSAIETIPAATLQPPTPTNTLTATATVTPVRTPTVTPTGTPRSDPPTCRPPSGWSAHTVQPGETLFQLALASDASVSELQAANCLGSTQIFVGQALYVPPPEPDPSKTPEVVGSRPPEPYLVEAEWPARIETRHSGTVRVSLIRTTEGYLPTVEIQGNTAVASTPIPVGTPDLGLAAAFGDEYEAYAVAHIAGAAFQLDLASSTEPQSLDQPRIEWVWNITSDHPGPQSLDVSIEVEWKRVGDVEGSLRRLIWREHLEIEVFQRIISTGQVSMFSLISAFLGSGLSIPWIYETVKKRKSQQGRKDKKRR